MVVDIHSLILDSVLEPASNVRELRQIIEVIEATDFFNVSIVQTLRYKNPSEADGATSLPSGNYI